MGIRAFWMVVLVLLPTTSWSQDGSADTKTGPPPAAPMSDADLAQAKFLLSGMKAAREALLSGMFELKKSTKGTHADRGDGTSEVTISCAFSYPDDLLRYDYTNHLADRTQAAKYISRSDESYLYTPDVGAVKEILTINERRELPRNMFFKLLDIRALGLGNPAETNIGTDLDEYYTWYTETFPLSGLTREGDEVYCLSFRYPVEDSPDFIERKLWIDAERGFTPQKVEGQFWTSANKGWAALPGRTEAEWIEKAGVWVPTVVRQYVKTRIVDSVSELKLDWRLVNEAPDAALFTKESFNLPEGGFIVDSRMDEPVIIDVIGDPRAKQVQEQLARHSKRRWWVIGVNVAVIVLLAGIITFKRFMSK